MRKTANAVPTDQRVVRLIESAVGPAFRPRDVIERGLADRNDIKRLVRGGYVRQARHGLYEIVEQPRVSLPGEMVLALASVAAEEDAYISWRSAMVFHGLTEQLPRIIYIAVRKPRRPKTVGGARVQYVVQVEAKRVDIVNAPLSGTSIRVASPEKAVLDCIERPDLSGGLPEITRALVLRGRLNLGHLVDLAVDHPEAAPARRLGFLLDALGLEDSGPLQARVSRAAKPLPLDLEGPAEGSVDHRWMVLDNVGDNEIRDWVDL